MYSESARAITVESGGAVTIGRMVAFAADGQVDHVASAQGDADGVAGETVAAAGLAIPMVVPDGGVAMIEAGAVVARGALIASDNVGRAITWVDAVGNVCMGRAHLAAAAAGDIIPVQFIAKKVGAGS